MNGCCRLCGTSAAAFAIRPDITLLACPRCRFVSGKVPDEQNANAGYADHYRGVDPPAPNARYEEWLGRAARAIGGPGTLLEIGAGSGGFVRAALQSGWAVHALETSKSALQRLQDTGCTVVQGPLEAARLASESYDFIAAVEVLEHVPSPLDLLRESHRLLRPGGVLLLTTPNYSGLSRRWLGLRWRVIAAEHLGYFEQGTLKYALRAAGFGRVQVRSRSLDLTSWRRRPGATAGQFDPVAAARMRDTFQSGPALRAARDVAQAVLGVTGLGDSLVGWARRPRG
jgi:SAM-dependent methyltransferase